MQISKRDVARAYQAITRIQASNEKQPAGFNYFLEKNRRLLENEYSAITVQENSTLKEYNAEVKVFTGEDLSALNEKYSAELSVNKAFLDGMTDVDIHQIEKLPDGLPSLFYSWLFPFILSE
jgi:hypothetical protein